MEVEKVSPAVQTHDRNCHLEELQNCKVEAPSKGNRRSILNTCSLESMEQEGGMVRVKKYQDAVAFFWGCLSVQLNSGKGKTLYNCVCLRSKKQQFLELSSLLIPCAQTVCTVK